MSSTCWNDSCMSAKNLSRSVSVSDDFNFFLQWERKELYPIRTNEFSHHYHLDESVFSLRDIRSNFSFLFHFR